MTDLDRLLADHATRLGIPGAQLAVLTPAGVQESVHGVLSTRTRTAVTPDAVFQIGSTTKAWAATLALMLVDDGLLDLDEPVARHLPDLVLSDPEVTATLTARDLLTHTSGVDGDLFLDTGRGDDCVARYVTAMSTLPALHPRGATLSYCNSGFVLLGHLLTTVSGAATWDDLVRQRLIEPLGLTTAGTLPEEALLHRAAIGHTGSGATATPMPVWGVDVAGATDSLALAALHLRGGLTDGGDRLLSDAAVRAMQVPQAAVPEPWAAGSHWGLGWTLATWDGTPVFGHDGSTNGQNHFLRALPEHGVALALSANGGPMRQLFEDLVADLVPALCGVRVRTLPGADGSATPDLRWVGRYARSSQTFQVDPGDGALLMTIRSSHPGADPDAATTLPLRVADAQAAPPEGGSAQTYVAEVPGLTMAIPVVFFTLPGGRRYLHFGLRSTPEAA